MDEPLSTSLGALSDSEWNILRNRWSRGIDWNVEKIGRKWNIHFGGFPLFKTKKAAYEAGANLICAESKHRYWKEHNA